jgi:NAD-dependent deacetylase
MNDAWEALAALLRRSQRVLLFSGAGISTESGIPDFRGPNGVWTRFDPSEFHIDRFLAGEASRRRYWQRTTAFYQEIVKARPNAAHAAVVALERLGKLASVVTQNVDGLHQLAGTAPEKVVELHGTHRFVSCLSCGHTHPRAEFQARVTPEGVAPDCERCGGPMKPATISFGQTLKPEVLAHAQTEAERCDLFLVVGSSLVVYPAANLPVVAARRGAALAIVNLEETPLDGYAQLVLRAPAGEALSGAVALLAADVPRSAAPRPS